MHSCSICLEGLGQSHALSLVVSSVYVLRLIDSVDFLVVFLKPWTPTILPSSLLQDSQNQIMFDCGCVCVGGVALRTREERLRREEGWETTMVKM